MSQKFRNFRRNSSPQVIIKLPKTPSNKLVTIHHAKPKQSLDTSGSTCIDSIAYKRSSERLSAEFARKSPNKQLLDQLLRETFVPRRKEIESSHQRTSELMKMYPFFVSEKLASTYMYYIQDVRNMCMYIQIQCTCAINL